jgi:hypothetical protein
MVNFPLAYILVSSSRRIRRLRDFAYTAVFETLLRELSARHRHVRIIAHHGRGFLLWVPRSSGL